MILNSLSEGPPSPPGFLDSLTLPLKPPFQLHSRSIRWADAKDEWYRVSALQSVNFEVWPGD